MTIRTWKDEKGMTYAKGRPKGTWVFWTFGVILMIINIPITIGNPIVGIILFIIGSLFFYAGKQYTKAMVYKKLRDVLLAEEKLGKQKPNPVEINTDWMNKGWSN